MLRLDGKVAFVSGAGSVGPGWGNGRATAVLLARQGARVFCTDLHREGLEETMRLLAAEGFSAVAHASDATDSAAVAEAMAECAARLGGLDLLVNNVGGSAPGGAEDMAEEVFDRQLSHNLKSAFLGCKHAIPLMRARGGGAIVNLASIAALRVSASRPHVGYTASKMAVIGLSRSVAIRHAKEGIRCNTVVPGLMHTPLVEHRLVGQLGANDAAELIARRHAMVPVGHMGDGWDVAHAALFLLSDEARFITGTEILVDGGAAVAGGT